MSGKGSRTDRAKRPHRRTREIVGKDLPACQPDLSWREPFLDALREMPNVKQACIAASVGRATVYEHRESDPVFAAAWEQAWEEGRDEIRRRIQERMNSSDRILELASRLWLPEYKDKIELSGKVDMQPSLVLVVKP